MTGDLDLGCDCCGQTAALTDLDAPRTEHALETWARLHEHDDVQRAAWYRSEEARAAAYRGDSTDPDGDETDGGYR